MDVSNIEEEDLIPEEEVAILLTHRGYIKRMPVSTYRAQRRGGKGVDRDGYKRRRFCTALVCDLFSQSSPLFLQSRKSLSIESV